MEQHKPDFRAIALPLIERGFRLTPLSPETKQGVMRNWQNFQLTSPEDIEKFAKYFPHHNVGVVGKRSVGRHCFLDIDADGVLARIESDTGHKMPQTYTVASRPVTKPFKRHYYFTQTEYSFRRFGAWASKNLNVRDLTRLELSPRSGLMIHPTLYDMKGVGGGSLVVAAGSVRDDGKETYACVDDSSVAPIPDWLVDWIVADFRRYRILKDRENEQKFKAKAETLRLGNVERRKLRKQNAADGFDIAEEDTYDFLRWRASTFSGLGITGNVLCQNLVYQARCFCENGAAWAESERGQATIDKIAREKRHVGDATFFYKLSDESRDGLRLTKAEEVSKRSVIREALAEFPDFIPAGEAIERIRRALELDGFDFDPRRDKNALQEIREEFGFSVRGHGHWERLRVPAIP
jgi:hypothetical protein